MQGEPESREMPAPDPAKPGVEHDFGEHVDTGRHGLVRRFLTTSRHVWGFVLGASVAHVRSLPRSDRRRVRFLLLRPLLFVLALPVNRELKRQPIPVQLRRRLERLGSTYIKLGQILSLREDLLPKPLTDELKHLLDKLPSVPYPTFFELVSRYLSRPVDDVFAHIRTRPLGSASIGQTHLATLHSGDQVIIKVVKPGIRKTLRRDTVLLKALGGVLQVVIPRYQPQRVIAEFCDGHRFSPHLPGVLEQESPVYGISRRHQADRFEDRGDRTRGSATACGSRGRGDHRHALS
jgi:ubiquinone biosynthesis protein